MNIKFRRVFRGGAMEAKLPLDQWNLLISGGFQAPTGAEPPPPLYRKKPKFKPLLLDKFLTTSLFNVNNNGIFHNFDQIMVSRVSLWIGHFNLCIEGHLLLRLQSLEVVLVISYAKYKAKLIIILWCMTMDSNQEQEKKWILNYLKVLCNFPFFTHKFSLWLFYSLYLFCIISISCSKSLIFIIINFLEFNVSNNYFKMKPIGTLFPRLYL